MKLGCQSSLSCASVAVSIKSVLIRVSIAEVADHADSAPAPYFLVSLLASSLEIVLFTLGVVVYVLSVLHWQVGFAIHPILQTSST